MQEPAAQATAAFGNEQALPQAPQLLADVLMLVSHPETIGLQSPNPGTHVETEQRPPVQAGAPPLAGQTWKQEPQLEVSLRRFTSHPFSAFPSQSWNPSAHVTIWHVPAEQTATAFAIAQAVPQPPQLASSAPTLVSQPFGASPSQFSQPDSQVAMAQSLPEHDVVACGRVQAQVH